MRHRSLAACLVALLAAVGAAACAPPLRPPAAVEPRVPEAFPEAFYLAALERGESVFRIEPQRSQVLVYAYRGGSLARLGHDHVIASRDVQGYVLLSDAAAATGRADLYVRLAALEVDGAAERAAAGFATQPSESDIAATRRNMLEKVLEAQRYPFALLRIRAPSGGSPMLEVELSLHGVTRRLSVPVAIEVRGEELVASGAFSLLQTDFGITPYSVLGGALQVQDRLDLRFRIHAQRLTPGGKIAQG